MNSAQEQPETKVNDAQMHKESNDGEAQQIILFRSKLTDQAGEDYQAMNDELAALVR